MRRIVLLLFLGMILVSMLAPEAAWITATPVRPPHSEVPPTPREARLQAAASGNLLVNGGMDDLPFYWMYPNHFVAGGWNRWWIHLTMLPEYDDTRFARPRHEGDHAQVYFKWFSKGQEYHAGIYQVVDDLMPCVPYRFTMWARNHTLDVVKPQARIGLDTQGVQLTTGPDDGAVLVLPSSVVWSAEQENLFVWEQLAVVAEPPGTRLTAIAYAHPKLPEVGGPLEYYADTFWDTGRLEQAPFPGEKLPAPSSDAATDFVSSLTVSTFLNSVSIEWDLIEPAPTQMWYRVVPPSFTTPVSDTLPYHVFLPVVQRSITSAAYTQATPLLTHQQTHYRVSVPNLQHGDTVQGVIVVRRPVQGACATEVSIPFSITIDLPKPLSHVYLPVIQK